MLVNMRPDYTGYPYARHADEITDWYRSVLAAHYPKGPDRDAKTLIIGYRDDFAKEAQQPEAPRTLVAAAVQWTRAVMILADAERELGRPGWQQEWTDAYEYFVMGNDQVFGPYGPAGP